uniref:Galectin n=1 Tax=Astyanax mexicanus TaxID=7994 RepID=A0A8B9H136_ASTMX
CSPQAIPYVGTIPEGIKPDMAVFAINFKTGSSDGDDVALHFKPRIGQKVTLSSFRNGKWESEESASAEPFTRGAPFTMFFTINTEGYEVFVNGVKHCMFKHRIPVEKIQRRHGRRSCGQMRPKYGFSLLTPLTVFK